MDIREFDETEIGEINSYVVNQIQNSVDLNQYFVLSEEPIKKTRVFVAIYRILNGVRDFIEKLNKEEHLDKELIISSDEEGNRYFSDISVDENHKHIMIIYGSDGSEVELEDYL